MGKIFRTIFDAAFSWWALLLFPLAMVGITWGMAGNWISYFWIIIILAVLIGEILNKIFSPAKKTLSSNVRVEAKKGSWRIWAMLIMWLLFSVQLFFHLIKPLILG